MAIPIIQAGRDVLYAFLITVLLYSQFVSTVFSASYPTPRGYVNDYANILSVDTGKSLEQQLQNFEKQTTHEVVLVTVPDLRGETIEEYAVNLFDEWNIGKEGKDNGVLLLISMKEREVRIEVGYGLEPVLPDGKAGEIIRTTIVPAFRENAYESGITRALTAIQSQIKGEQISPAPAERENYEINDFFVLFITMGSVVLQYIGAFLGRTKEWWVGGVLGFLLGLGLNLMFPFAIFTESVIMIVLFLVGLALDYILSKNYQRRAAAGLSNSWFSSKGGFGGSNTIFGGFGGGRSGGGGASSKW